MTLPNITALLSCFREILWGTWAFMIAEGNVPSVKRLALEVRSSCLLCFFVLPQKKCSPKTMPTSTCSSVV